MSGWILVHPSDPDLTPIAELERAADARLHQAEHPGSKAMRRDKRDAVVAARQARTHGGARLGGGRPALPPSERRVTVSLSLAPESRQRLDDLAEEYDLRGRGAVVEWMLERL